MRRAAWLSRHGVSGDDRDCPTVGGIIPCSNVYNGVERLGSGGAIMFASRPRNQNFCYGFT
jgi:hypothetical protein